VCCGVGAVDGLVFKVMASLTSKWWPKSFYHQVLLDSCVAVLCAVYLGDKLVCFLPALMYAVV
jgi:hypothetical protein